MELVTWPFRLKYSFGNESNSQMKVDFYCIPWMAAFESGGIKTLHFMTGMWWVQQYLVVGGVTVWGCFSFTCKLDLHALQYNLNNVTYRENVLNAHVVPHFDSSQLADRPIFMDYNARPRRACIVREFRQQEAIDTNRHFIGMACPLIWSQSSTFWNW